jgi:hypothetical protein
MRSTTAWLTAASSDTDEPLGLDVGEARLRDPAHAGEILDRGKGPQGDDLFGALGPMWMIRCRASELALLMSTHPAGTGSGSGAGGSRGWAAPPRTGEPSLSVEIS